MLPRKADAVVIGGGVIGASIAYHLAKRKVDVVLLEKGDAASGSSGACGGTIFLQTKSPGTHLELALASSRRFVHLEQELGAGFEYQRHGGMIVIESEEELRTMAQFVDKQNTIGLDVSLLDSKQARELEPSLSENILGATFSPMDAQVNPMFLTFAFLKAAQDLGAKILTNTRVTGFQKTLNCIKSVKTDKGEIHTGTVVNAGGVYAAEIGALLGLEIPVKPRRGQLVVTEAIGPIISRCLLSAQYIAAKFNPALAQKGGGISIEPTASGNFVLGSTREFAGFDQRVTPEGIFHIAKHVCRIIPRLKKLNFIRVFAGLRPYTPDGLPILGIVAGLDGFVMAAGHEGDGIALSPITGEITAALIVDNKTSFPIEEYELDRFDPNRAGKFD
jgi:glycine/D-amino acid oxidase-like deaminating enzyme